MARIPILMYHHIAPVPDNLHNPRSANLYVHPDTFAAQMRLLKRLGYQGLSMTNAAPYLQGKLRGRVIVITLDDGYVNNLTQALPILQQHHFSATCYAVSAAPGGYNHWNIERTGVREDLMDAAQLREWQAAGMEVGAHTRTHPHLTQCDDRTLREEIHVCRNELEDATGTAIEQFCYPYGDHDDRVVETVRDAGFSDATTTLRGRAKPGGDRLRWPRTAIKNHHGLPKIAMRVLTGL